MNRAARQRIRPGRPRASRGTPSCGSGSEEAAQAIAALRPEWDALADRLSAAPFLCAGWLDAWVRAFGAGRLELLAVRRDGRLAGLLPILWRRGAAVSPTNWHTPEFGVLAEDADVTRELAGALLARRSRRIDLSFLDGRSPELGELRRSATAAGHDVIARTVARSPYVEIDGDWERYSAGLRRKQRTEIARRRRRLEAEGRLSFELDDGAPRVQERLEEGFAIEGSGWKSERGTAIVSQARTLRFYGDVGRWAAEAGLLRMGFLRLDGRPLAFDLCLEAHGVLYLLKRGFDPAYRRFAPGALLTHESLQRAFARGLRSYEFLGTEDSYKRGWTTTVRERVRVQAFPRSPAGRLSFVAWRYGRPLAKGAAGAAARARSR